MAGTSLLALLDDIATVLDDIAVMTKVAAKKTAGVLGDDLALNAEQVSGIRADRELPVVWAVARGSFKNKLILVPAALTVSALAPWAVSPLLMLGGAYLCFEGFEKLAHKFPQRTAHDESGHGAKIRVLFDPDIDLVTFEREKIRGAVRTDFILSAEIIVIALGTVQAAALGTQIAVVASIAMIMTVGVYSLVAGIVKLDDVGLHLVKNEATDWWGACRHASGRGLLRLAPLLMKTLSIVGTAAMFLVGGGILMHGLPGAHLLARTVDATARGLVPIGGILAFFAPLLLNALTGILAGGLAFLAVKLTRGIMKKWNNEG